MSALCKNHAQRGCHEKLVFMNIWRSTCEIQHCTKAANFASQTSSRTIQLDGQSQPYPNRCRRFSVESFRSNGANLHWSLQGCSLPLELMLAYIAE